VLTNLQVTAFYFAAALVLLERGQGVLAYPLGVSKMRGFLREIATETGAWRSGRCRPSGTQVPVPGKSIRGVEESHATSL